MANPSGTCGTCSWSISANGTLTIGAGELAPNTSISPSYWPWLAYRNRIKYVEFGYPSVECHGPTAYMFSGCESLRDIAPMHYFNTQGATDMSFMFANCFSLISMDATYLNTSSARSMECMFMNCGAIETLNVRFFDTLLALNMEKMFAGCTSWTGSDFFVTDNPTFHDNMFAGCSNAEVYIIASGSAAPSFWRQIAYQYPENVYYFADSSFSPVSSLTVARCLQDGTESDTGTYAKLQVADTAYSSFIPYYLRPNAVVSRNLKLDGTSISPTFTDDTAIVSLGDFERHSFEYSITDRVGKTSAAYLQILPDIMPVLDFYHGSNSNGAAFGKLATQEGIIDSDFDYWEHGERAYPTFTRSSWSTSSDETTLPVTPCFVLDTSTNMLYWCSGSGISRVNPESFTPKVRQYAHGFGNVAQVKATCAAILSDMSKSELSIEVGVASSAGYHQYVAHRYPTGSNYGAVFIFDSWGQAYLYNLENGTATLRKLSMTVM